MNHPSRSRTSQREFTLRGVILGALITLAFTAANVYLGLKVGLTFASAIPAAVISMALLCRFKDSNILENNLVQTQASAAGHLVQRDLRGAGPGHDWAVDGLSVLADRADLRGRRCAGSALHHPPATRDGGSV